MHLIGNCLPLIFFQKAKISTTDEQKKKYATTHVVLSTAESEILRVKSATLSRNLDNNNNSNSRKHLSDKSIDRSLHNRRLFKHQQAYKRSLTLSLFEQKWNILKEKYSQPGIGNENLRQFWLESDTNMKQQASSGSELLRLLVKIFWTAICMLESDYEHEFVLSIEIISQILDKIDLRTGIANKGQLLVHKNEFRTNLELYAFRINWPAYPGLQNLLMKGCTCPSPATVEATQKLLVELIPHCSQLNFIDPNSSSLHGLSGVAMNLLALLPTLLCNYERPSEMCVKAAQAYCKQIYEHIQHLEQQRGLKLQQVEIVDAVQIQKITKLEQLKNLAHVMNLYSTGQFGKDRVQWCKCVITYLSEYFEQCQAEEMMCQKSGGKHENKSGTTAVDNFYYSWILFLTELLDKSKWKLLFLGHFS